MFTRKNVAVLVAEALGTAILTFSVLSIVKSAIGIPYFAAIGVGLTLSLLVVTLGATSGAHFNPAITLGLWTLRRIDTAKAIMYILAQYVGAFAAFSLYQYLTDRTLDSIVATEFVWPVFVAELVGTAIFGFGVAAALYQKYDGGRLALTIGGSLAVGILIAGVASNAALNPAVAYGIQSWDKTYIIAPIVGSIVGMNLYSMLIAGDTSLLQAKKATVSRSTTKKKSAKRK